MGARSRACSYSTAAWRSASSSFVGLGLHVAELGQDEVRFRALGARPSPPLPLRPGPRRTCPSAQQPRDVRADLARPGGRASAPCGIRPGPRRCRPPGGPAGRGCSADRPTPDRRRRGGRRRRRARGEGSAGRGHSQENDSHTRCANESKTPGTRALRVPGHAVPDLRPRARRGTRPGSSPSRA